MQLCVLIRHAECISHMPLANPMGCQCELCNAVHATIFCRACLAQTNIDFTGLIGTAGAATNWTAEHCRQRYGTPSYGQGTSGILTCRNSASFRSGQPICICWTCVAQAWWYWMTCLCIPHQLMRVWSWTANPPLQILCLFADLQIFGLPLDCTHIVFLMTCIASILVVCWVNNLTETSNSWCTSVFCLEVL